jgi:ADP-heptose:LPS heptosyltransferase
VRHYCGQDLAGRQLLAWRGCGVGDQLVFAGVLRILKRRYPSARIDYYCHPRTMEIWAGVPDLPFAMWPEPIAFDDWQANDYHLVGEGLCEGDREPDQPNVWDAHLRYAGLDPAAVPLREKRPLVPLAAADRCAAAEWLASRDLAAGRVLLWQLAASTPIRSVAPRTTARCLAALSAAFPRAAIVVVGTHRDEPVYAVPQAPNIWPVHDLPISTVFALVERADCLVCPDSCLSHVAGAFGTLS